MNNRNFNVSLLNDYTIFLKSILENVGYNFSNGEIMEITDYNFNTALDFFCRSFNNRAGSLNFRIVTEDVLERYIKNPMMFSDVRIIYSHLPFNKPENLIRKLSLVPVITPAVAVFGAYGLMDYNYKRNLKYLDMFKQNLEQNNLSYDYFYSQTSDKRFELIVSRGNLYI